MQIAGGRLDVFMPHQNLDRPQVCACLQQMRGEAVAQSVRRDMLFDASFLRCFLHR